MEYICYHATWCPFCRAFIKDYRSIVPQGKEEILDDESDPIWTEMGIDYVPTVIEYENGKETRRLSSRPGVGITREMFVEWLKD
jgi:hypothetical protein